MARRRGHGEGSIVQYGERGRWRVQLTLLNGERTGQAGFATRREAQGWLNDQLKRMQDGVDITPQRVTVGEFLERWLRDVVRMGRRPNTVLLYEGMVRDHLVPAFGAVRMADLRGHHLQRLYANSLAAGLAPGTVRLLHTVLHAALVWAVRWDLITRNVAESVQPPARSRRAMTILDPEQARRLIEGTADDRNHALWVLALTTGMRQGELLALTWDDVDLDVGEVRVAGTLGRDGEVGPAKTTSSRRLVGISPLCVNVLRRHRVHQLEERLALGDQWRGRGRVFTTSAGTPADGNYARENLERTLKRLSLPAIRFHDLRHTAATLMLAAGLNPKIVQERLGHSTITMTMDTYSHVLPGMQADAALRVDQLLTG